MSCCGLVEMRCIHSLPSKSPSSASLRKSKCKILGAIWNFRILSSPLVRQGFWKCNHHFWGPTLLFSIYTPHNFAFSHRCRKHVHHRLGGWKSEECLFFWVRYFLSSLKGAQIMAIFWSMLKLFKRIFYFICLRGIFHRKACSCCTWSGFEWMNKQPSHCSHQF